MTKISALGFCFVATVLLVSVPLLSDTTSSAEALASRATAFLEWESGTWDAEIQLFDPSGGQPQRFRGEQTDVMGGGGGWLITDLGMVAATPGAAVPPYQGHGVLGFDPQAGKLVGIWIDSATNWLATAEGTVDPAGKVMRLEVQGRDPATGSAHVKEFITTRLSEDRRRLEIRVPTPHGSFHAATIDYTRRNPAGAAHR